jgi:hypothetical protein
MEKKFIESSGNSERDTEVLAEVQETLVNKESFEDARKRERAANEATAKQPDEEGASRNALTDQPFVKGQVIAVVNEGEKKSSSQEFMDSLRTARRSEDRDGFKDNS